LNRQVLRDDISRHYSRGELLARLNAALIDDGVDPERPTIEALAPYDQFHGRGIDATAELAASVPARRSDHILDVGSGIGGPARYLATRFGCRVTGIDLTAEFCDVARHLTRLLGLDAQVVFENGDALHAHALRRPHVRRRLLDERVHEHRRQGRVHSRDSPRAVAGRVVGAVRDCEG
jgi:SAM-dependent methyltransferase